MKRYFRITLLLSLFVGAPVQAAEEHFHYHITFLVALAVGWSWEEARLIASANLALDTNETTIASLEITGRTQLPHVSPKSLRFHCFSAADDRRASRNHTRNPDVIENLASLEARANDAVDRALHSQNPLDISQALVTIGVYLHCQQDSWFHSGFGGQWDGHALESLFAMILRIPDPDQAAARPAKAERALDEMLEKLTNFRRRWGGPLHEITPDDLAPLKRILTHRLTNKMTKRERAACDQRLAGRWLYQLLVEQDRLLVVPAGNVKDGLAKPSSRCRRVQAEVFSELGAPAWGA
ncbi:MAG: hypothetical protein K6T71_04335, partial [Candidatus Bipolaricaulota bacterium]|nr:hypothetical protein [Candidatus Bipolaricaulota bacterium]